MKKILYLVSLIIFIILQSLIAGENYDPQKNYLEDAKMFFNYHEYEKVIECANIIYKHDKDKKNIEEALYLINESAEEIVENLRNQLYIATEETIKKEIDELDDKYNINITLKKVGYEYIIYYDKKYYYKLLKLNPKSDFIETIELRNIARTSKFITDNVQRYKDVNSVLEKYWKIFNANPKSDYAAQLLLKIADLYLYLGEEGENIKTDLGISDQTLADYFQKAKDIYRRVKKEYPNSQAANALAYTVDNVKLRKEPKIKSKVVKQVPAGTMVKIIDQTDKQEAISNMYDYWFKVKLISGLEGWVYGFYLRTTY